MTTNDQMFDFPPDMSKISYQKNFVKQNWTLVGVEHWQP